MLLDKDAFSSGQVGSKIWLAGHLEHAVYHYQQLGLFENPLKILLVGGWYGVTNFILQCRQNLKIETIRSIDIDPTACENADLFNEYWVWQDWTFKAIVHDANTFKYSGFDIVINTSVEHIDSLDWFYAIPDGTLVALQSNDMPHDDHVHNHSTLDEFSDTFRLSDTVHVSSKDFIYPDWKFKRFMKIGVK